MRNHWLKLYSNQRFFFGRALPIRRCRNDTTSSGDYGERLCQRRNHYSAVTYGLPNRFTTCRLQCPSPHNNFTCRFIASIPSISFTHQRSQAVPAGRAAVPKPIFRIGWCPWSILLFLLYSPFVYFV